MSDIKKIWVTGAKGFLGSEVSKRLEAHGFEVIGTDSELTVTDSDLLQEFAADLQPQAVVNCAGIPRSATGLSNRIKAYEVNALGARNVALAANTVGAKIVHVSTDDVYAARMREPVNEFDNPHPDTPYGKSKRAGEMMVRDTTPDHVIIRSSWLYHVQGGRLKALLDAAKAGEKYSCRTDQFAAPTSVKLFVDFMVKAIESKATGTFHIVPTGETSRFGFAAKALEICGYDPSQVLIPETDLVTAERVILESLMLEMIGVDLPSWEEDLRIYLEEEGYAK